MSADAQTAALDALTKIVQKEDLKDELRIEAAKVILNRPRFFVDEQHQEK